MSEKLVTRIRSVMDTYSTEELTLASNNIEMEVWRLMARDKTDQEIYSELGFEYQEDWQWLIEIREQFNQNYIKAETKNKLENRIFHLIKADFSDEEIFKFLNLTDPTEQDLVKKCRKSIIIEPEFQNEEL
jgi:hypothetical protein